MPPTTPIDDLSDLSDTGSILERILKNWVIDLGDLYGGPDIVTMGEAIEFLARLTAIRKSLINISRSTDTPSANAPQPEAQKPVAQPPSAVISVHSSDPSDSSDPSSGSDSDSISPNRQSPELASLDLPESHSSQELQEIRSLRALPFSAIRPALNQIADDLRAEISETHPRRPPVSVLDSPALELYSPHLPLPTQPASSAPVLSSDPPSSIQPGSPASDSSPSLTSLSSLTSLLPDASSSGTQDFAVPAPDRRAVLLNLHPAVDTTAFPDCHPIFDRDQYGCNKRVDIKKFIRDRDRNRERNRNRSG